MSQIFMKNLGSEKKFVKSKGLVNRSSTVWFELRLTSREEYIFRIDGEFRCFLFIYNKVNSLLYFFEGQGYRYRRQTQQYFERQDRQDKQDRQDRYNRQERYGRPYDRSYQQQQRDVHVTY